MKLTMIFLGATCLMDKFDEPTGGAGGAALSEADFQSKVMGGISSIKTKMAETEKDLLASDTQVKKAHENIAEVQKNFTGLQSQQVELTKAISTLSKRVGSAQIAVGATPLDKILGNEDHRAQVNAVMRGILSKANGGDLLVRMNTDQQKMFGDMVAKAIDTNTAPGATYLDDDLVTNVYSLIATYGIWNVFDVMPATTKTTKLIVDDTDPVMTFVDESTDPAETAYTGRSLVQEIKKIMGWISVSNEILEDSEIDLAGFILPKFANATALRMDFATLTADGTADQFNGGFTGIFTGGTTVTSEPGRTTVASTKYTDWLKVLLAVEASVLSKPGACWIIHPRNLVRLVGVMDDNGRPIFQNALEVPSPGAIGTLLGYPVKLAHAAPSTANPGDAIAAFGDPEAMSVLLRRDLEFAISTAVQFLSDKTVFRARARMANLLKKDTGFGVFALSAA